MRLLSMQDWAERLWPGDAYLQARWIEAVRIVRATRNGWVLDRMQQRTTA